jgi:hypothetical protein
VRGVQKHDKKNSHKNLTNPGTFLASEEPTNHPKVRKLFLSAPCQAPATPRAEGPAKKIDGSPSTFAKSQTHPPTIRLSCFLASTFLGVSRYREFKVQKHHNKYFFPKKNDKNFDVSFPSIFLVLSRFRVFRSNGSSKTLQKTFYKEIVSKSFYKKIDKKSKPFFFSILFITFLGVSR